MQQRAQWNRWAGAGWWGASLGCMFRRLLFNRILSITHLFQDSDPLHSGHWFHRIKWWVFWLPSPTPASDSSDVRLWHFPWTLDFSPPHPPDIFPCYEISTYNVFCRSLRVFCYSYSELHTKDNILRMDAINNNQSVIYWNMFTFANLHTVIYLHSRESIYQQHRGWLLNLFSKSFKYKCIY